MEQIIALIVFALIAIGGSVLRKYLEKQQREQQAAERHTRQRAQRQQGRKPYRKPTPQRKRLFYGRPGETRPEEPTEEPATETAVRARPRPSRTLEAAEPDEVSQEEAARRSALQEAREGTRLGRLARTDFPTLATMGRSGLAAALSARKGAVGQRGAGRVDFLGGMLQGRNLARAVVLSEILGPPKGLQ